MAKNTDTTTPPTDPIVKIQILENGILIGDAHHAIAKIMDLELSKAETLAALNPPAVKIIGIP